MTSSVNVFEPLWLWLRMMIFVVKFGSLKWLNCFSLFTWFSWLTWFSWFTCCLMSIGVRAGEGEGGCSSPPPPPPKSGQLRFFGQREKSPFYLIILKTWILTWSRRNNPVTLQWFLSMWWVIYIFAVFFWLGTILHCTSWNGLFPVENWLK